MTVATETSFERIADVDPEILPFMRAEVRRQRRRSS